VRPDRKVDAAADQLDWAIQAGFAVIVPAGAKHNIINTGSPKPPSLRVSP